eukprot:931659_1
MTLLFIHLLALLRKYWIQTIRRPAGSSLIVLIPTTTVFLGFYTDVFRTYFAYIFPAVFMLSFLRTFCDMVEEKENRTKEAMCMIGLKEPVFVLAHCLAEVCRYIIVSLCTA